MPELDRGDLGECLKIDRIDLLLHQIPVNWMHLVAFRGELGPLFMLFA